MDKHELGRLINEAIIIPQEKWWHYYCCNDVQELNRITCHFEKYELQFNEIFHSEKQHIHTVDLTSVILKNGYTWNLQQFGAQYPLELFAAENSIIRMGPNDTHWIPKQNKLSLSFCIFEKQTRWDRHYNQLSPYKFNSLFQESISLLRKFNDEFIAKQQMLFSWPD